MVYDFVDVRKVDIQQQNYILNYLMIHPNKQFNSIVKDLLKIDMFKDWDETELLLCVARLSWQLNA